MPTHKLEVVASVPPSGTSYQSYEYGIDPPNGVTTAAPKQLYEHKLCVVSVMLELKEAGDVTPTSAVSKQPLASLISALYVPAQIAKTVSVSGEPGTLYQSIRYGDTPPE